LTWVLWGKKSLPLCPILSSSACPSAAN